ncbi:MAG: lysozyme, partial [Candidatus Liberibacter solanacearum]
DWESSSHEIRKWVFAGGKKLNGLVLRREVEAGLL